MEYIMHKGALMVHQRMGRLEGLMQVVLPETDKLPPIKWHGTKVPRRLWNRIKAFCLWSQQQFNSEVQIRLYYNDYTNRWRAVPFPQFIGTGLFSEEINESKLFSNAELEDTVRALKAKLLRLIEQEKGWYEFGTVHHHCTASAFQSGTDHKDEIERPGIHITLGGILSDIHSVHARCVKQKRMYDVDLSEWVDGDMNQSLVCFPGYWTKQCFEEPKPVYAIPAWRRRDKDDKTADVLGYGSYDNREDCHWYNAYARALTSEKDKKRREILDPAVNYNSINALGADAEEEVLCADALYQNIANALSCYTAAVAENMRDPYGSWSDWGCGAPTASEKLCDEMNRKASLHTIQVLTEFLIDQMKDHFQTFKELLDKIGIAEQIEDALVAMDKQLMEEETYYE